MAGDGYRGRMSPHTPNEKFEGATVLKTLQVHEPLNKCNCVPHRGSFSSLHPSSVWLQVTGALCQEKPAVNQQLSLKLRSQHSKRRALKCVTVYLRSIFREYTCWSVLFFSWPAVRLRGQSADEERSSVLRHQWASEADYWVVLPAQLHLALLLHTPGVPDSHHRSLTRSNMLHVRE